MCTRFQKFLINHSSFRYNSVLIFTHVMGGEVSKKYILNTSSKRKRSSNLEIEEPISDLLSPIDLKSILRITIVSQKKITPYQLLTIKKISWPHF